MDDDLTLKLERRLGRVLARQRLGMEADREARIAGPGLHFFQIDRWYSAHSIVRIGLKVTGLHGRARRNAERIAVTEHEMTFRDLPPSFDGFTILHVSDLHGDISDGAMRQLNERVMGLRYDLCVLTGDFRGNTFGPFEEALRRVGEFRSRLTGPVHGVLGNHDPVHMLPGLEAHGIRMLMNEVETIERGDQRIHVAGVDDAHYFRLDNVESVAVTIPAGEFSILLSHTPEIYRQAAHAGFRLMLSGHTHGGQLCLPGSIPLMLSAKLPRRLGAGAWRHGEMVGYTSRGVGTSLIPVRLNCPAEITLHRLRRGEFQNG